MQGKEGGLDGSTRRSVQFNGATGLGAVADNPGQVFEDIADRPFHLVHIAADKIGDSRRRTRTGRDRTAADGGQPAGMGLDIGGDNMAEANGPQEGVAIMVDKVLDL